MSTENNPNNLNNLNDILFETLNNLKEGKTDVATAKAVCNLGGTIIQNAKLQLEAYKITEGQTSSQVFLDEFKDHGPNEVQAPKQKPEPTYRPASRTLLPNGTYERQALFAKERGFNGPSHAIGKLGKETFMAAFADWMEKKKQPKNEAHGTD